MNCFKVAISAIILSATIFTVSADKLSPDTRIRLERRASEVSAQNAGDEERTEKVFILFEKGFASELAGVPGVEVQSLFEKMATAIVTPQAIDLLCEMDQVRYIQLASEVKLRNDWGRRDLHVDEVHLNTGNQLPRPFTGKGVIVGLIDTGVEYGHRAYFNNDGSQLRIRRVWEQNGFGNPPEGFSYGRELDNQADILLSTCDSKSEYHGSHTMGTAAGGGNLATRYYGMAPESDIVFVSFKNTENTSVADGIKYIFDYADKMDMPCVVNLSLGSHHGPHDGTSILDQMIDQLSGPGRIVVGACGNEGESKMHASKTFTEDDLTMKTILTFSTTQNHKLHYLDIWGTPGSNLKVGMAVFNTLKGQTVDASKQFDTSRSDQNVVGYFPNLDEQGVSMDAVIYGEINPENNAPHVWIEAEVIDAGQGRLPGLIIEGEAGATVHLWNEGLHEFSSNNKKGFTNGDFNSTVGEIGGTAKRIITVGSYDGRDSLIFKRHYWADMNEFSFYKQYQHSTFSSYGPTADGRTVPHIVAPGLPVISALNRYAVDSQTHENDISDYTTDKSGRKYYYIYNIGTSMSAPHVSGIVALMLQAHPNLTPEEAREIIQSTATTSPEMGELPNNAFGAGRINALECVRKAVELSGIDDVNDDGIGSDATHAWVSNGEIHLITPCVGSTLRLYNVTGQLLKEVNVTETETVVNVSGMGHGIVIAELSGQSNRRSFKLAL